MKATKNLREISFQDSDIQCTHRIWSRCTQAFLSQFLLRLKMSPCKSRYFLANSAGEVHTLKKSRNEDVIFRIRKLFCIMHKDGNWCRYFWICFKIHKKGLDLHAFFPKVSNSVVSWWKKIKWFSHFSLLNLQSGLKNVTLVQNITLQLQNDHKRKRKSHLINRLHSLAKTRTSVTKIRFRTVWLCGFWKTIWLPFFAH